MNIKYSYHSNTNTFTAAYTGRLYVVVSLSRVYEHSKSRNMGGISAFASELTPEQNLKRSTELRDWIRKAGYGFMKVKGHYLQAEGTPRETPVVEEFYIVIGDKTDDGTKRLNAFLRKASIEYNQESVLLKKYNDEEAYLIFHSGEAKGISFSIGPWLPTKIDDHFSTLKKGRSFKFLDEEAKQAILEKKKEDHARD